VSKHARNNPGPNRVKRVCQLLDQQTPNTRPGVKPQEATSNAHVSQLEVDLVDKVKPCEQGKESLRRSSSPYYLVR
jgi:hypothetical protein